MALYSDVIRERFRHPRFRGTLPDADATFEDVNPLCGDRIRIECRLADGKIADARFTGDSCAIAAASADVLLEMIVGQPVERAHAARRRRSARAPRGGHPAVADEVRHAAALGAPGRARRQGGGAMTLGEITRPDFPILRRIVNGHPLVYLDSAASSQKPAAVIEAIRRYYEWSHANVHRSIHTLGEEATELYEAARDAVRVFVGARSREEIVFTRGTTEGVNLVAQALGRTLARRRRDRRHRDGAPLEPDSLADALPRPRHRAEGRSRASKAPTSTWTRSTGCCPRGRGSWRSPMSPTCSAPSTRWRRSRGRRTRSGAVVVVDGAQAAPHLPLDVAGARRRLLRRSRATRCSGPTGIGVLYGRREVLERLEPAWGGGEMIKEVWIDHAQWNDLPWRFEPGTPPIAGAVGLHAAVEYLGKLGMDRVHAHEQALTAQCLDALARDSRRDHLRAAQRRAEGRGGGLQRGRPSPARRRRAARPAGHRGARRASLRPAADEAPRHRGARCARASPSTTPRPRSINWPGGAH